MTLGVGRVSNRIRILEDNHWESTKGAFNINLPQTGTHREGRRQRKATKFLRDQFQLSVVPLTLSLLTLKLSDQIFPEKLQDFTFLAKGKFPYWAQCPGSL